MNYFIDMCKFVIIFCFMDFVEISGKAREDFIWTNVVKAFHTNGWNDFLYFEIKNFLFFWNEPDCAVIFIFNFCSWVSQRTYLLFVN